MSVRLVKADSKHLYEVEVQPKGYVEVEANTSAQAVSRAEKAGYEVKSVNMVG